MRCEVKHTSPGRVRVHLCKARMSLREADVLEYYLRAVPGVTKVQVLDRTCDAVISYSGPRADVTRALSSAKINNANMSVCRDRRGGDALMVIETDQKVPPVVRVLIGELRGIRSLTYYEKEE